jgi:ABC-type nitrate/sulfonate/bicarbonate transport system permease component
MGEPAPESAAAWFEPLLGIGVALLVWEIAGRIAGDALFAPFSHVLRELLGVLADGRTLPALANSLLQMLAGYVGGLLIGMPLGVLMGRQDWADRAFHPWVSMMLVTSTAALVPLLIVLLGTGFVFRATIVFLATVWYVTLATYQGARGIDPRMLAAARSYGAGGWQTFWLVILPALFPFLLTGARVGLVHAIRAMVMAEMYVLVGFGGLLHQTGLSTSTAPLLCYLLLLMVVSIAATGGLRLVGRRLAPWYEERLT